MELALLSILFCLQLLFFLGANAPSKNKPLFFKGLLAPILADFFRRVKRKNFFPVDNYFRFFVFFRLTDRPEYEKRAYRKRKGRYARPTGQLGNVTYG